MENRNIVSKTVAYIEVNLDKKLNLDEIAKKVNYSKFHLNRLFSKEVGCTIYKYIQMRRLTEAAKKLAETDKPIVEIAYEANYNSQQSFTLAFKQVYLYTPQVYRTIRVFNSKRTRFTMKCSLVPSCATFMKREGMAA